MTNVTIDDKELFYSFASGFFDGEGYIGMHIDNSKNPIIIQLITSLTNTDIKVLIKLEQEFGGHIHKIKKQEGKKHSWHWDIQDRITLKKFLTIILPYSIVKKQQIEYGLKFLELTRNSRNSKVTPEEQKIRQFFADKIKEMKYNEFSDEELKMYAEEIKNIKKVKGQSTMEDY